MCIYELIDICSEVSTYYASSDECKYICIFMQASLCVLTFVSIMYVFMYVVMYVCMYVCMYLYVS